MGESTALIVAIFFGALSGGGVAWLVRNEIGKRRLKDLESRWNQLHRKTERQRDELNRQLKASGREVATAERDLRAQARKCEEALRLVHKKKMRWCGWRPNSSV